MWTLIDNAIVSYYLQIAIDFIIDNGIINIIIDNNGM